MVGVTVRTRVRVSNLALGLGMGFVLNFLFSGQHYAELFPQCIF